MTHPCCDRLGRLYCKSRSKAHSSFDCCLVFIEAASPESFLAEKHPLLNFDFSSEGKRFPFIFGRKHHVKSFAVGRCCGFFCATSVLNVINSPGFIASCLDPKVGDVAYGGGSQLVNNATRDAFQTYLHGQVPVEALRNRKKWENLVGECCCVGVFSWRCGCFQK